MSTDRDAFALPVTEPVTLRDTLPVIESPFGALPPSEALNDGAVFAPPPGPRRPTGDSFRGVRKKLARPDGPRFDAADGELPKSAGSRTITAGGVRSVNRQGLAENGLTANVCNGWKADVKRVRNQPEAPEAAAATVLNSERLIARSRWHLETFLYQRRAQ